MAKKIPTKPKDAPQSSLEAKFQLGARSLGVDLVYQYKIPGSRYIWDAAHLPTGTLIEVDGGQWQRGAKGHGWGKGMERDCRKQNEAVLAGWRVLRFCTSLIESGEFMDTVEKLKPYLTVGDTKMWEVVRDGDTYKVVMEHGKETT